MSVTQEKQNSAHAVGRKNEKDIGEELEGMEWQQIIQNALHECIHIKILKVK